MPSLPLPTPTPVDDVPVVNPPTSTSPGDVKPGELPPTQTPIPAPESTPIPFPTVPAREEERRKAILPVEVDTNPILPPVEEQPERVTTMLILDSNRVLNGEHVLNGEQMKARVLAVTGESIDGASVTLALPDGLEWVP